MSRRTWTTALLMAVIVIGSYAFIHFEPEQVVAGATAPACEHWMMTPDAALAGVGDDELITQFLADSEHFDTELFAAAEEYFRAGLDERLGVLTPEVGASTGDKLVVYRHSDGIHRRVVLDPMVHATLYAQRAEVYRLGTEIDRRHLELPDAEQ